MLMNKETLEAINKENKELINKQLLECITEELDNYNFDVIDQYPKQNFIDTMNRIRQLLKGGGFIST